MAFSFFKFLKIHPKAVRTRTNKGSLIGQVFFRNNLTFFYIFESIKINNMDLELILELNGTLEVIMFFVLLAALFGAGFLLGRKSK